MSGWHGLCHLGPRGHHSLQRYSGERNLEDLAAGGLLAMVTEDAHADGSPAARVLKAFERPGLGRRGGRRLHL